MVNCRDRARLANKKIKDLKRQVARAINSKPQNQQRSNHLSEDTEVLDGYDDFMDDDVNGGVPSASAFYNNNSRAEQTLSNELYKKRKRENLPSDFQQKFAVRNNKEYPCHPIESSRFSDYPVGFQGCLGCGSVDHQFTTCKNRENVEGRKFFHFQLHCHHPDVFFKNHDNLGRFKRHMTGEPNFSERRDGVGRGRKAVAPAWMGKRNDRLSRYKNAENDTAPQYVIRLSTYNLQNKNLRRMPITTRNELPHLRFPIGTTTNDGSLLNLFDTGAALNTGQLSYHLSQKNSRPNLVNSYEEFNGTNPFDPIKLCGAITDPSTFDTTTHGILSAVIRYKTPFSVNGRTFTIAFALGKDVSVNSIMGLPTITELKLEYTFDPEPHFTSSIIERNFNVELREAACSSEVANHLSEEPESNHAMSHNKINSDPTVIDNMKNVSFADEPRTATVTLPPSPPLYEAAPPSVAIA
jgi:hypothetical protein